MKEAGKSMVPIFPWRISDSVLNNELICLAWVSKFPKALNKPAQTRTATSKSPALLTFPCPQLLFLVLHNPLSRQHRQFYLLLGTVSAGSAAKRSPHQPRKMAKLEGHEDAETIKQSRGRKPHPPTDRNCCTCL